MKRLFLLDAIDDEYRHSWWSEMWLRCALRVMRAPDAIVVRMDWYGSTRVDTYSDGTWEVIQPGRFVNNCACCHPQDYGL